MHIIYTVGICLASEEDVLLIEVLMKTQTNKHTNIRIHTHTQYQSDDVLSDIYVRTYVGTVQLHDVINNTPMTSFNFNLFCVLFVNCFNSCYGNNMPTESIIIIANILIEHSPRGNNIIGYLPYTVHTRCSFFTSTDDNNILVSAVPIMHVYI